MKKLFLIIAAGILFLQCFASWASDPKREINLIIKKTLPVTRSFLTIPEASVCGSMLTVSFDSFGLCSLYIKDSFGRTVFTSTLSADGMESRYDLSALGQGDFTLTIVSQEGEYEGYFSIY